MPGLPLPPNGKSVEISGLDAKRLAAAVGADSEAELRNRMMQKIEEFVPR